MRARLGRARQREGNGAILAPKPTSTAIDDDMTTKSSLHHLYGSYIRSEGCNSRDGSKKFLGSDNNGTLVLGAKTWFGWAGQFLSVGSDRDDSI